MTLDTIKNELHGYYNELKQLLLVRRFELVPADAVFQEICFNEFSYHDTFQNEVDDNLDLLTPTIDKSFLYELDTEKKYLLVEYFIEEFSTDEVTEHFGYQDQASKLTDRHKDCLTAFEELQDRLRWHVAVQLKKKYLGDLKVDKAKITRIQWLGNQKELAELFDQLRLKHWIKFSGSANSYYKAIDLLFDVPGAKDLVKNFKDYHTPNTSSPITTQGIFSVIPDKGIKKIL